MKKIKYRFDTGDRVKIIGSDSMFLGKEGIIEKIMPTSMGDTKNRKYSVENVGSWIDDIDLELIPIQKVKNMYESYRIQYVLRNNGYDAGLRDCQEIFDKIPDSEKDLPDSNLDVWSKAKNLF